MKTVSIINVTFLILLISCSSCFKKTNSNSKNLSQTESCPLPTCSSGKTAVNNDSPVNANGCGPEATSFPLEVINAMGNTFGSDFKECCNKHDTCYGTCGTTKADCDAAFYSCMKGKCNKKNSFTSETYCKLKAKTFYELVNNGSKCYFNDSQVEHCTCA